MENSNELTLIIPNNGSIENNGWTIATLVINITSIICNVIIVNIIETDSPFLLMAKHSVYAEAFINYSIFMLIFTALWGDVLVSSFGFFTKYNFFTFFNKEQSKIIERMLQFNTSILLSSHVYSYLMHIFIFIELVFLFKYPMGNASLRSYFYRLFTWCITLICFGMNLRFDVVSRNLEELVKNFPYTYILISVLFVLMLLSSKLSLFYSIKRLGCKNIFSLSYYNKFIVQQSIMTMSYFILIIPFHISVLLMLLYGDEYKSNVFLCISKFLFSSVGFIQFFGRIIETNALKQLKKLFRTIFFCFKKNENLLDSSISNEDKSKDLVSF